MQKQLDEIELINMQNALNKNKKWNGPNLKPFLDVTFKFEDDTTSSYSVSNAPLTIREAEELQKKFGTNAGGDS